jgi:hypothetical protein
MISVHPKKEIDFGWGDPDKMKVLVSVGSREGQKLAYIVSGFSGPFHAS